MAESKGASIQKVLVFLGIASCTFAMGMNSAVFRSMRIRDANTRRAIQTMRYFHTAQVVYCVPLGKGNFAAQAKDFSSICGVGSCPLDLEIATMQTSPYLGYIIASMKATPKTPDREPTYSMVIVPEIRKGPFRTGNDCFYVDQTGEIRHSGSPIVMPDANSPLIQ